MSVIVNSCTLKPTILVGSQAKVYGERDINNLSSVTFGDFSSSDSAFLHGDCSMVISVRFVFSFTDVSGTEISISFTILVNNFLRVGLCFLLSFRPLMCSRTKLTQAEKTDIFEVSGGHTVDYEKVRNKIE